MVDQCLGQEITNPKDKSKWIIRMELDKELMLDKKISMDDLNFAISNAYEDTVNCVYSDYNSDKLIFRIRLNNILSNKKKNGNINPLDQSDEIYLLKNFQDQLLNNTILSGIKKIKKVILRKTLNELHKDSGKYNKKEGWVLDTVGTNLMDILALDYIDVNKTISNDIQEIYRVLGIEAARQAIFNELTEVIEHDGGYINYHHLTMLCDRMCYNLKMISIFRHGINNDDIGPIAKASFEETPEMFLKAARHGELDEMRGVSANVMCGQEGYFGTSSFQVVADINAILTNENYQNNQQDTDEENDNDIIDKCLDKKTTTTSCDIENITIKNNASNIKTTDLGCDDDDYDINF